jgi:hypothetical protein
MKNKIGNVAAILIISIVVLVVVFIIVAGNVALMSIMGVSYDSTKDIVLFVILVCSIGYPLECFIEFLVHKICGIFLKKPRKTLVSSISCFTSTFAVISVIDYFYNAVHISLVSKLLFSIVILCIERLVDMRKADE